MTIKDFLDTLSAYGIDLDTEIYIVHQDWELKKVEISENNGKKILVLK